MAPDRTPPASRACPRPARPPGRPGSRCPSRTDGSGWWCGRPCPAPSSASSGETRPTARITAPAGSRFTYGDGRAEVVPAPGDVIVELPRSASATTVDVDGATYLSGSAQRPVTSGHVIDAHRWTHPVPRSRGLRVTRLLPLAAGLLVGALAASRPATAQVAAAAGERTGAVEGKVTGRFQGQARPLPYALVEATWGDVRRSVMADAEGRYRLEGVRAGDVRLSAVQAGYARLSLVVSVPTDGAVRLDLELRGAPMALPKVEVRGEPVVAAPSMSPIATSPDALDPQDRARSARRGPGPGRRGAGRGRVRAARQRSGRRHRRALHAGEHGGYEAGSPGRRPGLYALPRGGPDAAVRARRARQGGPPRGRGARPVRRRPDQHPRAGDPHAAHGSAPRVGLARHAVRVRRRRVAPRPARGLPRGRQEPSGRRVRAFRRERAVRLSRRADHGVHGVGRPVPRHGPPASGTPSRSRWIRRGRPTTHAGAIARDRSRTTA